MDAGAGHPFGQPTKYELIHEGKCYPPKAVVGLAFRHLRGQILGPKEFSGGEAPGQANYVLRRLGFTVPEIAEEDAEKPVPKDWSEQEVRLIVADYYEMLELELLGKE